MFTTADPDANKILVILAPDALASISYTGAASANSQWMDCQIANCLAHAVEDRPGRDGFRVAVGRTASGRTIRVIYIPDPEPQSIFVITAYELRGKPLAALRRRRRRKGQ